MPLTRLRFPVARLLNIVHADTKLYLVFEFLDVDLKRYMDHVTKQREVLSLPIVKVSLLAYCHVRPRSSVALLICAHPHY